MKYSIHIGIAFTVFFYCLSFPFSVFAQSQSISVTPPLFQLSIKPGDVWQSTVRVVNTNNFPLTVFADVVNFVPEGEGGLGKFMPVLNKDEIKATLAEWIDIAQGPYTIPEGRTQEISFFVDIPQDASPGGHFAAILVSTEPPKSDTGPLALVTTQTVATLFFTRIEGDVIEKASIREFSVVDRSIELPVAEFSLRVENKGNVHIQPRGNIIITNMWGKERGIIPVNNDTHFGNVLPLSIRDFRFTWKGERSLTDIGRYKAMATLAYGEDGIQTVTEATYFWVIPVKGALITLLFIAGFVASVTWMIRLYVRRMLILAGVNPDVEKRAVPETRQNQIKTYKNVTAPLKEGTLNLRSRLKEVHESTEVFGTIVEFLILYKKFFIALLLLILGFVGVVLYIGEVSNSNTEYEITIDDGDSARTITNEEIEKEREGN